MTDTLIVVVRYFGGTLLGTSGLINAYKSASADAIAAAKVAEKIATARYRISFDYAQMNAVMKCLKEMRLPVEEPDFGSQCTLTTCVRLSMKAVFFQIMQSILVTVSPFPGEGI